MVFEKADNLPVKSRGMPVIAGQNLQFGGAGKISVMGLRKFCSSYLECEYKINARFIHVNQRIDIDIVSSGRILHIHFF